MQIEVLKEQVDRYYQLLYETTQLCENWAKRKGITRNTILTLCTLLSEKENCTQKIICEKWNMPKQTVHTILKDFEQKGYVTFMDMPLNRRNRIVALTDIGTEYATGIAKELYQLDFQVLEKIGLEKMTALNEGLSLYIKSYQEIEQSKTDVTNEEI